MSYGVNTIPGPIPDDKTAKSLHHGHHVSQFKDATLTPPCYTRQASTDWPCYEATRYEMCSYVQILHVGGPNIQDIGIHEGAYGSHTSYTFGLHIVGVITTTAEKCLLN
ncbi:hypothetical protein E2C01_018422 [Portunus trituberculatus]|uniref:Uncharacterized protein n=1 Tax=Portunus trituberculatus TaxID=210409 RepID=A0A5B7DWF0_PORTR|nr:hypothetical protein [Portunus trituberculatus]